MSHNSRFEKRNPQFWWLTDLPTAFLHSWGSNICLSLLIESHLIYFLILGTFTRKNTPITFPEVEDYLSAWQSVDKCFRVQSGSVFGPRGAKTKTKTSGQQLRDHKRSSKTARVYISFMWSCNWSGNLPITLSFLVQKLWFLDCLKANIYVNTCELLHHDRLRLIPTSFSLVFGISTSHNGLKTDHSYGLKSRSVYASCGLQRIGSGLVSVYSQSCDWTSNMASDIRHDLSALTSQCHTCIKEVSMWHFDSQLYFLSFQVQHTISRYNFLPVYSLEYLILVWNKIIVKIDIFVTQNWNVKFLYQGSVLHCTVQSKLTCVSTIPQNWKKLWLLLWPHSNDIIDCDVG